MPHVDLESIADGATFESDWQTWHDEHERHRAAPHGFLAVVDLQQLDGTPRRFDSVPGAWSVDETGPVVELDPAIDGEPGFIVDSYPVSGRHEFGALPKGGTLAIEWGERMIELASRGGKVILRPRDPDAPLRTNYAGTPSYAPDVDWAVAGEYVPFEEPRSVTVDSALSGLSHVYQAPGVVEFAIDDVPLQLTVFNGATPGSLYALFRDQTSGVTTYPATRSLSIDAPLSDGSVLLDFNRAVNLPCAYIDFATCPLPPAENTLPVAVTAGEQMPHERAEAAH